MQHLSSHIYNQIFPEGSKPPPKELVELSKDHLRRHKEIRAADEDVRMMRITAGLANDCTARLPSKNGVSPTEGPASRPTAVRGCGHASGPRSILVASGFARGEVEGTQRQFSEWEHSSTGVLSNLLHGPGLFTPLTRTWRCMTDVGKRRRIGTGFAKVSPS